MDWSCVWKVSLFWIAAQPFGVWLWWMFTRGSSSGCHGHIDDNRRIDGPDDHAPRPPIYPAEWENEK